MQRKSYPAAPDRTTIMAMALEAAGANMAVFPVFGKVPLTAHGYKDASRDRARVTAMFNAAPSATGYGIATGSASGIVVVDVDGPEARAEAERRGLQSGYVVRTGRDEGDGFHVYLRIPDGVVLRSRALAPGLELKAEGAYVVGPGSAHPSGRRYTAVKDGEPSNAPDWILQPRTDSGTARENIARARSPVAVDTAGAPIPDGERNRTLTRIARRSGIASSPSWTPWRPSSARSGAWAARRVGRCTWRASSCSGATVRSIPTGSPSPWTSGHGRRWPGQPAGRSARSSPDPRLSGALSAGPGAGAVRWCSSCQRGFSATGINGNTRPPGGL